MRTEIIYDIAGIGIGPFNLGLAALCDPVKNLKTIFIERKPKFSWHEGMMIPGTTLQVSFLADLVTLANPISPFSYLNFLRKQNRLLQFGIYEKNYITRTEYNRYCRWVCSQLKNLKFDCEVTDVQYDHDAEYFEIYYKDNSGKVNFIKANQIVLGTGTSPYIPSFAVPLVGPRVMHSCSYMYSKPGILNSNKILLVGSGQSAAEIFYDILTSVDPGEKQLTWITQSDRFFSMETSKFCYELTSPDYINFFYGLNSNQKQEVLSRQNMLYKGINRELLEAIYDRLYHCYIETGNKNAKILPNTCLDNIENNNNDYMLSVHHTLTDEPNYLYADSIILATGYQYKMPRFLNSLKNLIRLDNNEKYKIERNYSIDNNNKIFVQNAEMHTHGFNAPDLGLGPYRNAVILKAILGYEYYPVDQKTTFQNF